LSIQDPALSRLLVEYKRRLTEHLGERVVGMQLFGSYARGEAGPESDVDVAVILDRIEGHADRVLPMELAGDLLVEHGMVILPIVLSAADLEMLRRREDLLARNLDEEGIAL
jgi:predicted nucleotidyltransferase